MKSLRFIFALGSVFSLMAATQAAITINEIRIDQTGTDNDEYFELAGNVGDLLASLFYIVIGDGVGGSGVIESITALPSVLLAANYYLCAETTFTMGVPDLSAGASGLAFENTDNVTHMLVFGFTGALNQDLDTNDDGILDLTPWTSILDSLAVVVDPTATTSEKYYSSTVVGPDGLFAPGHVYRDPNFTGPWKIGQFNPIGGQDTPGKANVPEPGTWAAMATGVVGLLSLRRRK